MAQWLTRRTLNPEVPGSNLTAGRRTFEKEDSERDVQENGTSRRTSRSREQVAQGNGPFQRASRARQQVVPENKSFQRTRRSREQVVPGNKSFQRTSRSREQVVPRRARRSRARDVLSQSDRTKHPRTRRTRRGPRTRRVLEQLRVVVGLHGRDNLSRTRAFTAEEQGGTDELPLEKRRG